MFNDKIHFLFSQIISSMPRGYTLELEYDPQAMKIKQIVWIAQYYSNF